MDILRPARSHLATNPMRTIRFLLALLAPLALVPALAAEGKKITLEQTTGGGRGEDRVSFGGAAPSVEWASDGVHLAVEKDGKFVWIDPETGAETAATEPPEDAQAAKLAEERKKAFAALPGMEEKEAARLAGRRGESSDDDKALLIHQGDKHYFHRQGGAAVELTLAKGAELSDLSPDGAWVGYVAGGDLHITDTAKNQDHSVTSGGGPLLLHGKLDWVYQEEVYGRGDFKAFWWSSDSKHVAFLKLDEAPVHDFTVIDDLPPDGSKRVLPEVSKYPKAGDPNPIVTLGAAASAGGEVVWMDLSRYKPEDEILIVRVGWNPTGDRIVFQVQDRIQTWLDLCYGDPRTGKVTVLVHETSPNWVNILEVPRWLKDGTFLWQSERTGHKHLYRYKPEGELVAAVTSGDWDVWDVVELDEERGLIWFSGNKDGAVGSNVYRIGLDGKGLVRLTQGRGTHEIELSTDRKHFIDRWSSLSDPPSVRVCNADGKILRELGQADVPAVAEYNAGTWELLQIPARDGYLLDAALLKPASFDPKHSYPVWVPTYSGPDAPSVSDRWSSSTWYQFLAQEGVLVFQVNVRSASRRGQQSIGTCYKQLGVGELQDLEDAVAWLTGHPWADAKRVGITGWSYGGTMTAYALTHSKAFSLGIAGAGVYDWRMYDTIYTERYMSTPQLNPEGYEKSSVLAGAKNLDGRLVLLHGTMDDNVHLQNTIQLVYALQQAGKDFELMLYPESRHGVGGGEQRWHMRRLEWRAIREHLLGQPGEG
jgi:dipeptidyl-peptidase 4